MASSRWAVSLPGTTPAAQPYRERRWLDPKNVVRAVIK
jgi:hypothetical protein